MPDLTPLDDALVERLVQDSLDEDRVDLDLTTQSIAASLSDGTAEIIARADGVICGLAFATAAFEALDPDVEITAHCADGDSVAAGDVLATVRGHVLHLLRAERTALNWLQRLSGTATLTATAVAAATAGGHAQILDTRKTTPGLRAAERYAVRCGGGLNHRDSSPPAILLKDNHIAAVGSITDAVHAALEHSGPATAVEVEVANLDQAREALDAGAPALLLDNFAIADLPRAVELAHRFEAAVEASGGIAITQINRNRRDRRRLHLNGRSHPLRSSPRYRPRPPPLRRPARISISPLPPRCGGRARADALTFSAPPYPRRDRSSSSESITTVNGPSFTSSTSISAPNSPRATAKPLASSCPAKRSTSVLRHPAAPPA